MKKPASEIVAVPVEREIARLPDADRARFREYVVAGRSPNTKRAYSADVAHFAAWCASRGVPHLPASVETVGGYLTALARGEAAPSPRGPKPRNANGRWSVASIERRRASIGKMHRLAHALDPCADEYIDEAMATIRREHGKPQREVRPMLPAQIVPLVIELRTTPTPKARRDAALILTGFGGAFRRDELASLDVADLTFNDDGVSVFLRHSKSDQQGRGVTVNVPSEDDPAVDPVTALRAWMADLPSRDGPLFRGIDMHGRVRDARMPAAEVSRVVKRLVKRLGFDPKDFGGHSLRAGFVTAAFADDIPMDKVKDQSRHVRFETLVRYNRQVNKFKRNAAKGLLRSKP